MKTTTDLSAYMRDIGATPLLSPAEEREVAMSLAGGDHDARDRLIASNLKLVVKIAGRFEGRGLDLADLCSEGNFGLLRAVETYDPTFLSDGQPVRFPTYASYWIKLAIQKAIHWKARSIRFPSNLIVRMSRWKQARAALATSLGREPTADEINRSLRLSRASLAHVVEAIETAGMVVLSADDPQDESGFNLGATISDHRPAAADLASDRDEIRWVLNRLVLLDEAEARVVKMRFGLHPFLPMTLVEVGRTMGLSRESIRKIEARALAKLRGDR